MAKLMGYRSILRCHRRLGCLAQKHGPANPYLLRRRLPDLHVGLDGWRSGHCKPISLGSERASANPIRPSRATLASRWYLGTELDFLHAAFDSRDSDCFQPIARLWHTRAVCVGPFAPLDATGGGSLGAKSKPRHYHPRLLGQRVKAVLERALRKSAEVVSNGPSRLSVLFATPAPVPPLAPARRYQPGRNSREIAPGEHRFSAIIALFRLGFRA